MLATSPRLVLSRVSAFPKAGALQVRWVLPVLVAWATNHALRIALRETDGSRLLYLLHTVNPWNPRSHLGLELIIVAAFAYTLHVWSRPGLRPMLLLSTFIATLYAITYLHYYLMHKPATLGSIADIPELLSVAPLHAGILLSIVLALIIALLACLRRPRSLHELTLPAVFVCVAALASAQPSASVAVIDSATHYDAIEHTRLFYRGGSFVYAIRELLQEKVVDERLSRMHVSRPRYPFEDLEQALSGLRDKRNVHIVLLESHVDPHDFRGIDSFNRDPVDPRYRKWRDTARSMGLSPVVGGRTANAELEVLCGVPAYESLGAIPFNEIGGAAVPCLPRLLGDIGYRTTVGVPTDPTFFNATTAYQSLGFAESRFADHFDLSDLDGILPSTESVLKQSLAHVRERIAARRPLLNYVVTIAGHFPYDLDPDRRPELITATPALGELGKIINHAYYASQAIADYVDELRRIDPDALIVMFSDHVPPLPTSEYQRLDYLGIREATGAQLSSVPLIVIDRGEPIPVGVVPHYLMPEVIVDRLTGGKYCKKHECQSQSPRVLRPPLLVGRTDALQPTCSISDIPLPAECVSAARLDRKLRESFHSVMVASRASH